MIRPPPRSPLFPYTTLFRPRSAPQSRGPAGPGRPCALQRRRSEEHTSELQSLTNLVCRLLLEKKKTHEQLGGDCVITTYYRASGQDRLDYVIQRGEVPSNLS